ncbi:hypothetical protein VTH82DRAFT_1999 [Thermothelomyces myriococcoides]
MAADADCPALSPFSQFTFPSINKELRPGFETFLLTLATLPFSPLHFVAVGPSVRVDSFLQLLHIPRSNLTHTAFLSPSRRSTAFGPVKGNHSTTASSAVSLVSDQDFGLRKTFHIINVLPPPAEVA